MTSELSRLPGHQATTVRPFAEWHVVRDARRRATRHRYTHDAASDDVKDVQAAIRFLAWLDERELQLAALGQADFHLWLTSHPTQHVVIGSFIRRATARRLTGPVELPKRERSFAVDFQTADEYDQQLRRCLNDSTLPREVRIIGALVRLYALPVTKIINITDEASPYLPPGKFPHRPRNPHGMDNLLRQHGLPVLSPRNTAMIEAATTLPPIVVADLFGLSPATAETWARYANDSWTHYLAARA